MDFSINRNLLNNSVKYHGQVLKTMLENQLDVFSSALHHSSTPSFLHTMKIESCKRTKLLDFVVKNRYSLFNQSTNTTSLLDVGECMNLPCFGVAHGMNSLDIRLHCHSLISTGDIVIASIDKIGDEYIYLRIIAMAGSIDVAFTQFAYIPARLHLKHLPLVYLSTIGTGQKVQCVVVSTECGCPVNLSILEEDLPKHLVGKLSLGSIEVSNCYHRCRRALNFFNKALNYNSEVEKSYYLRNSYYLRRLHQTMNLNDKKISFILSGKSNCIRKYSVNDIVSIRTSRMLQNLYRQGLNYFARKMHSEAFQCFNRALRFDEKNSNVLVACAMLMLDTGNYLKAIESFNEILNEDNDNISAKTGLNRALLEQAKTLDAKGKMEEAHVFYNNVLPDSLNQQNKDIFVTSFIKYHIEHGLQKHSMICVHSTADILNKSTEEISKSNTTFKDDSLIYTTSENEFENVFQDAPNSIRSSNLNEHRYFQISRFDQDEGSQSGSHSVDKSDLKCTNDASICQNSVSSNVKGTHDMFCDGNHHMSSCFSKEFVTGDNDSSHIEDIKKKAHDELSEDNVNTLKSDSVNLRFPSVKYSFKVQDKKSNNRLSDKQLKNPLRQSISFKPNCLDKLDNDKNKPFLQIKSNKFKSSLNHADRNKMKNVFEDYFNLHDSGNEKTELTDSKYSRQNKSCQPTKRIKIGIFENIGKMSSNMDSVPELSVGILSESTSRQESINKSITSPKVDSQVSLDKADDLVFSNKLDTILHRARCQIENKLYSI